MQRHGFIDKEDDLEKEKLASGAFDDNIVFGDEQVLYEESNEPEHVVEKDQWAQEQDEILIENYASLANLEKKSRFTFLAELVGGGKTYKDCYNRAKLLKLKNGTVDAAKEISRGLLSKQGENTNLKDRLVRQALQALVKHLEERSEHKKADLVQVRAICEFLGRIEQDYTEYMRAKDDIILFGRTLEMADMNKEDSSALAMRVVPVTP